MSLLKALHAATTLAAVQDLLATQVLTTEDLATADVYDLSEAIRSKGNAVCIFTRDDLDGRFDGTPAEAETWLSDNASRIGDRLSETGNQVIDDLLAADGLDKDDDDGESDDVIDLIYGADGHPAMQVEGARTVLFSDRNGYFYVDEVQGGERYTIATGLTQDQADAIENGAEVSDFKWTLKRDGRTDAYFNTYTDAHEAANSGGAVPFRIIPPLAERDRLELVVFSGGINLGGPGNGFFYAPVDKDDEAYMMEVATMAPGLPIYGPFDSVDHAKAAAITAHENKVVAFQHEEEDMPDWLPLGF